MGFPNYDVVNMRVDREGPDNRSADAGRTERHIQKTCVTEEYFLIRMSK
jgi:hypothetical protein